MIFDLIVCLVFQQNENKIAEMYQPVRRSLKQVEEVGVPQILSARDGKAILPYLHTIKENS